MAEDHNGYSEPAAGPVSDDNTSRTATMTPPPPPPVPPRSATGASEPEPPKGHHSPGVGFAAVLIFLGVLLLAAQFIPGLAWWSLWPLIIVAAGAVQAVTPGREGWNAYRFFDGLVTVSFGLVFLAITLGVIGWGVWWRILGLWPVLLIAIGFDILGKSLRSTWLRVIGSVAIIAALAYSVAVTAGDLRGVDFAGSGQLQEVSMTEELRREESATLKLNAGVADMSVSAGDELITLDGSTPFGEPQIDVERSGDTAEVSVRLGEGDTVVAFPGGPDADLDMTLSDQVVWDLEMETGLSTMRADLSDLQVRSLSLRPGIADCRVTLGDPVEGEGRVSVKAGISTVSLRLPEDAEVRLESSGGLSTTNVHGGLRSLGDRTWETSGFEQARDAGRPVWIVMVESGIGTFDLSTY